MSEKKMSNFTKVLIALYIPIAILCLIAMSWFLYYSMYLKDHTLAFDSKFVGSATYAEDQTYFMEVQVFPNCIEVKINYYVDTNLPEQKEDGSFETKYIMSSGVQFYSTDPNECFKSRTNAPLFSGYREYKINMTNCTFYTKNEGASTAYVAGGSTLANEDKWLFDIAGNLCAIKSIGRVKVGKEIWTTLYNIQDMARLIQENYKSFQSFNDGVSVAMFNFSKYFDIFMDNGEGKFVEEVADENILNKWNYFDVKVTVNKKDLISSKQSMFNSYKGDSNWNADGTQGGEAYWTDYTIYDLGIKDFKYVEAENGYELELKNACVNFLKEFSNVVCNVEINLDDIDPILTINGFTKTAFKNLGHELGEIKIVSTSEKTFEIYNLQAEFTTQNVTLLRGGVQC